MSQAQISLAQRDAKIPDPDPEIERKTFIVAILVIQMIPAEAMIISTFRVLDGWQLLNTVIGLAAVYIAAPYILALRSAAGAP